MSPFPWGRAEVVKAGEERMKDYLLHKHEGRLLIEMRLQGLLDYSDFGEIESVVEGITYIATVNRKSICGISGRFDVEVGRCTFTVFVEKNKMMFIQFKFEGISPKWKM